MSMESDNTIEQAVRRLLYAMFEDVPERAHGKALRLIAAVVEAHEAEMDRAHGEIVETRHARDVASAHVAEVQEQLQAAPRIDPDAWKTPLFLDATGKGEVGDRFTCSGNSFLIKRCDDQLGMNYEYSPVDAARLSEWLASYAAAHGEAVGTPEPAPWDPGPLAHEFDEPPVTTTRPVKVRFDCTAEEAYKASFNTGQWSKNMARLFDYLATRAVIDVPEGVPGAEGLANVLVEAHRTNKNCRETAQAILDHLAPWLQPRREPVDVEELARMLYERYHGVLQWGNSAQKPFWRDQARAAIAHLGLEEKA